MIEADSRYNPIPVCVEVSEWKVGHAGHILYTEGLGPCVGIAITDTSQHIAALGHFLDPRQSRADITRKIASFVRRCSPETTRVYVRGGCRILPNEAGEVENGAEDRQVVLEILSAVGLSPEQIDVVWSQNRDDAVDMQVNPHTGEMEEIVSNDTASIDYGDDIALWEDLDEVEDWE